MKYVLKPIWAICLVLCFLFVLLYFGIIWLVVFLWNFKSIQWKTIISEGHRYDHILMYWYDLESESPITYFKYLFKNYY